MGLLFAATLFVSAALLFVVQPIVAKMILPLLGGTPAVWITCMLFFQAALLLGYLYAHAAPRWFGMRRHIPLHLVLLLLALPALPLLSYPLNLLHREGSANELASRVLGTTPSTAHPTGWLLGVLAVCVGLPFFVVATSAPLLQKWFAGTRHRDAGDPYFLYGASNIGSMLALLGYPTVIEPNIALPRQLVCWGAGYVLLIGLTAVCAVALWRARPLEEAASPPVEQAQQKRVTNADRLWWVVLAFVPSGLLLGVTTYVSTDVAAIPLLWVVPLALYLLTFILAFARRSWISTQLAARAVPVLILFQLFALLQKAGAGVTIPLHLLTFFMAALACHGELARRRPPVQSLTEFYVWMSVGGALGGVFSAVLAPMLFTSVAEYPLELALACAVGPSVRPAGPRRNGALLNLGLPLVAGFFGAALMTFFQVAALDASDMASGVLRALAVGVPVIGYVILTYFAERPLLFGLGVSGLMLAGVAITDVPDMVLYRERTFFGVLRVSYSEKDDVTTLFHGSTVHGREFCSPSARSSGECPASRRDEPLTYYHAAGPIGQVFRELAGRPSMRRVGVVGLGAGSLASYGVAGQEMVFYEIDPAVRRIAFDLGLFSFTRDSRARLRVEMGDGRLSLRSAPHDSFGLLILDAFSSDAVPVHLLTREALRDVYLPRMAVDGVIAYHVSNRYLDLWPVLGNLAHDLGLACLMQTDDVPDETGWAPEKKTHRTPTTWVILAREARAFGRLAADQRWEKVPYEAGGPIWTDDFSNVLSVFRWGKRAEPGRTKGR